jgi:AAA family ATP:ADP antiporter
MKQSLTQRLLKPFVEMREGEGRTLLLMFLYSFLAMAGYNVIKPATRSVFIDSLGTRYLPHVLLLVGVLGGVVVQGYNKGMSLLPRRLVFPVTQVVMVGFLLLFWALFRIDAKWAKVWVPVGFYFWGALAALLLISQFWTLANDVFDPRQAKRLFGFIGGGSSLGGILGAGLAGVLAKPLGTNNLLLVGAGLLGLCFFVVSLAVAEKKAALAPEVRTKAKIKSDEKGMSLLEAGRLLVQSKHFQLIAMVISFASIGAGIIDMQLNMSAESLIKNKDLRTAFFGNVTFYASIAGFLIQVTLTSRIHRILGIGFALLILPIGLGSTGLVMLLMPALWSSSLARVMDTALRYTADKTTREILFVPLPTELKYKAKPFADVAVDRLARGVGTGLALMIAVNVFHLKWWELSYLSIPIAALWAVMAVRAKKEYLETFRRSIATRDVAAGEIRSTAADQSTIETLVEELAHPDPTRVLYAIDLLESYEKRHLITPLLLRHESPEVRIRALGALGAMRSDTADRWSASVERLLKDESPDVRAAAVRALAVIHKEAVGTLMRPYLHDLDPRVVATAAMALADSGNEADADAAEEALRALGADTRQSSAAARREVAGTIAQIKNPRFHPLLIPLFYDADVDVARAAIQGAERIGLADSLFVPSLVALLRNRLLKRQARAVLVGYGEDVLDILAYFLRDQEEDIWVRRHIPGTLAQLPRQKSMDVLMSVLDDPDGFLRFKVVTAIEKLRRSHPELTFPHEPIEALVLKEGLRYFNYLSLQHNLFRDPAQARESLLARSLSEKLTRTVDRIFRLLGLIYPWKDIAAAQWALAHGDARARSGAAEFLDNLLAGNVRKRIMPVLEELPVDEKVRKGNVLLRSRPRNEEETLLQLVHDDDQVVAAAAIHLVEERKVWKLADALEYTLEHRDLKDWYVFEAASWALAAHRMPADRRRELWLEPLPAVELANRLRRIPLFDFVSVDELFRIGGMGRQVRYETGQVLYHKHTPATTLQFLLDGKVAVDGDGAPGSPSASSTEITAPGALAFDEVLEGRPSAGDSRAIDRAICLALDTDEFYSLLSDNTMIAQGLFRMLLGREAAGAWRGVLAGPDAASLPAPTSTLTPIQKMVVLQAIPVFARASGDELMGLAGITRQVALGEAGAKLFGEADAAAIYTVLSGELRLEPPQGGAPTRVGPGETVGVFETLVGGMAGLRATVTVPGAVLRIEREDLFDQLADHVDLLQGVFSALLHPESAPAAVAQAGA